MNLKLLEFKDNMRAIEKEIKKVQLNPAITDDTEPTFFSENISMLIPYIAIENRDQYLIPIMEEILNFWAHYSGVKLIVDTLFKKLYKIMPFIEAAVYYTVYSQYGNNQKIFGGTCTCVLAVFHCIHTFFRFSSAMKVTSIWTMHPLFVKT